mgnify:CR=1 FL=1
MGKFTPGPWKKSIASRPGTAYSIAGTVGTAGEIAEVKCIPEAWGDHIANAHLIAAAPDLFKAGEMLMNSLDMVRDVKGIIVGGAAEMRSALKKARGEK